VKEKAIDSSINAVAITNQNGTITYVNHSLTMMFGYEHSELLGIPVVILWKKKGKYVEVMDAILDHDGWVGELEAERHDKSVFYVQLSGTVVRDEKNDPLALMTSFVDITERKKAIEKIQESEQMKTEFMNIAAHELKTPLIPIQGYLEMLQNVNVLSDEQKHWIDICLKNVNNLKSLVDEILDVARLESNSMKFSFETLNVTALLNEIAMDMQPSFVKQALAFSIHVHQPEMFIVADALRIKQVVRNLLSNALKFTPKGSIQIQASIDQKNAIISIIDTGIGISLQNLPKLFLKFSQVGDAETRQSKGTGLGLYICKKIIEAHHGWIKVESQGEGQGTTITFSLPLKIETVKDST
jgi:PAS domain S-box-containing protein